MTVQKNFWMVGKRDMAWVQVTDDGDGATPQSYTDEDGDTTMMTVQAAGGAEEPYYLAGQPSYWIIGDDSETAAELHGHSFTEPVHVLRVDVTFLDDGDFANFAYEDVDGGLWHIDLNEWINDGHAVVNLGDGHSIEYLPSNPGVNGLQGSNTQTGRPAGTSQVEFYFPKPVTNFFVGRNAVQGKTIRDAYAYQLYYDDHDSLVSDEPPESTDPAAPPPAPIRSEPGPDSGATCFTSGTLISTESGETPVDKLRVGDAVHTLDHGLQKIRWIGARTISRGELAADAKLLPVRIKAGAIGPNLPQRDLVVSRQHRILVRSSIAQRMFHTSEILVPAIKLVGLEGIELAADEDSVTYWHMLFDQHEIVFAEGAPTESLFTGPEALKSMSAASRAEIETMFPHLLDPGFDPSPARLIPDSGPRIRQLVARHVKNSKKPLSP